MVHVGTSDPDPMSSSSLFKVTLPVKLDLSSLGSTWQTAVFVYLSEASLCDIKYSLCSDGWALLLISPRRPFSLAAGINDPVCPESDTVFTAPCFPQNT